METDKEIIGFMQNLTRLILAIQSRSTDYHKQIVVLKEELLNKWPKPCPVIIKGEWKLCNEEPPSEGGFFLITEGGAPSVAFYYDVRKTWSIGHITVILPPHVRWCRRPAYEVENGNG